MAATVEWRSNELWIVLTDGAERRPIYSLVYALGGSLRGFRFSDGRFESRLTFRDLRRIEPAEHLLRLAFDAALPDGWVLHGDGGRLAVVPPADLIPFGVAAYHRLRAELCHRADGASLLPAHADFAGGIRVEANDSRLARWIASAFVGLALEGKTRESPEPQASERPGAVHGAKAEFDAVQTSIAIVDLQQRAETDPAEVARECRRLLANVSSPEHALRLSVVLGDALTSLGKQEDALSEYRKALVHGPDAAASFDATRVLRAVLIARGCAAGEDPAILPWLVGAPRIGADPGLLLLCAEAATVQDTALAADLIARAVPGRGATIGPIEADRFVAQVEGNGIARERLGQLVVALGRATFPVASDVARAVAELRSAVDPLDGEILTSLIELDVVEAPHWLPERLERLLGVFGTDAPLVDRPHKLARLARPLREGVEYLFAETAIPIDTSALHHLAAIAIEAALAAGDLAAARSVLRATNATNARRLEHRQLVDLADLLAVHPTALGPLLRQDLIDLYVGVGYDLIERYIKSNDPYLFNVVLRSLQDLDAAIAEELHREWQTRTAAGGDGGRPDLHLDRRPLDGLRIVVFGGDQRTGHRARERLTELGAAVDHIPPAYEQNLNQEDVRQRLTGTDLVIEVWRQMKHRDSDALAAALEALSPAPVRRHAAGTGLSSIVREALAWAVEQRAA